MTTKLMEVAKNNVTRTTSFETTDGKVFSGKFGKQRAIRHQIEIDEQEMSQKIADKLWDSDILKKHKDEVIEKLLKRNEEEPSRDEVEAYICERIIEESITFDEFVLIIMRMIHLVNLEEIIKLIKEYDPKSND